MSDSPKFDIGQIVIFEGEKYKVIKVFASNWFLSTPFVYSVVKLDGKDASISTEEQIMEQFLMPEEPKNGL